MKCSMPVFLEISGITPLFIWCHSLRLILAGKIMLSLGVIRMGCYNNIISWITQAWLSNIKESISGCHATQDFSVMQRCNKESCQWQVLKCQGRAERGKGCLRSPVVYVQLWWMKCSPEGIGAAFPWVSEGIGVAFPWISASVCGSGTVISGLATDLHPEGGGSDYFSDSLCS